MIVESEASKAGAKLQDALANILALYRENFGGIQVSAYVQNRIRALERVAETYTKDELVDIFKKAKAAKDRAFAKTHDACVAHIEVELATGKTMSLTDTFSIKKGGDINAAISADVRSYEKRTEEKVVGWKVTKLVRNGKAAKA